jgi:hypothetical protein
MELTALIISARATSARFKRCAPIAYLLSAPARMRLMFINDELVDLRAELLLAPIGSEAWQALSRSVRDHEIARNETATEVLAITGKLTEMRTDEAVVIGIAAGFVASAVLGFLAGWLS